MKKYPITFTTDFSWFPNEEKEELYSSYNKERLEHLCNVCKKYKGEKISLLELEEFVKEVGDPVIFDGEDIEVYNDYRE